MVTDSMRLVPHASQHTSDGHLEVVLVEKGVPLCVGWFPVDKCNEYISW